MPEAAPYGSWRSPITASPIAAGQVPLAAPDIASGHDFFSSPRISPDGRQLAWLTWDHPRMAWDGSELWVAGLAGDGSVSNERCIAGGPEESIFQPEWSPAGELYFVSDRT